MLAKYDKHHFVQKQAIEVDPEEMKLAVYDIDYFAMRLNVLETFDEGEFVLASKIKVKRKFLPCTLDPTSWTHYTQIYDQTVVDTEFKG